MPNFELASPTKVEAPPTKKAKLSSAEVEKLRQSAEANFQEVKKIAELLAASGSRINVRIGDKPGWSFEFNTNTINVDLEDLATKSPDYCKGVVSHEAAHELISRIKFIPREEWNKRGFRFLLNAVEDPRVNNWIADKFAGPREWLKQVYDSRFAGDTPDEARDAVEAKMNYTPKHIEFGLQIIEYWHTGKFAADLPADVLAALQQTIKIAEACYNIVPSASPSPGECTAKAQLVYNLINGAIYPIYQQLLEKAQSSAEWEEKLREMIESGDFELGEGESGEGGQPIPWDDLPEDLRKKLEEKINEKLAGMDPDKRKKLEAKAGQAAKDKIDGATESAGDALQGKFGEPGEGTEQARKDQSQAAMQEELNKEMAAAESRLNEMRSAYEKAVLDVRPEIDDMTQFFINEFMSKRQPVKKPHSAGSDINMASGGPMKFEATGDYSELFLRTQTFEKNEFRITILVDLSGSMDGAKIAETFKALAMVAETLTNVEIPFAIFGFQDNLYEFKKFDEPFDAAARDKLMTMLSITHNEGAHCNSDGFCVEKVYRETVLQNLTKTNLFIVMSDGLPAVGVNRYKSELSSEDELKQVTAMIQANPEVDLIGFGVGPDTDHVRDFYRDHVQAKKVQDVPKKLKAKLREKIVA